MKIIYEPQNSTFEIIIKEGESFESASVSEINRILNEILSLTADRPKSRSYIIDTTNGIMKSYSQIERKVSDDEGNEKYESLYSLTAKH